MTGAEAHAPEVVRRSLGRRVSFHRGPDFAELRASDLMEASLLVYGGGFALVALLPALTGLWWLVRWLTLGVPLLLVLSFPLTIQLRFERGAVSIVRRWMGVPYKRMQFTMEHIGIGILGTGGNGDPGFWPMSEAFTVSWVDAKGSTHYTEVGPAWAADLIWDTMGREFLRLTSRPGESDDGLLDLLNRLGYTRRWINLGSTEIILNTPHPGSEPRRHLRIDRIRRQYELSDRAGGPVERGPIEDLQYFKNE